MLPPMKQSKPNFFQSSQTHLPSDHTIISPEPSKKQSRTPNYTNSKKHEKSFTHIKREVKCTNSRNRIEKGFIDSYNDNTSLAVL